MKQSHQGSVAQISNLLISKPITSIIQPAKLIMSRMYLIYAVNLLSAALVYFGFAAMSSVAADITWVPIMSFTASIFHFGISSWLFFIYNKAGKIFAIITAILLCIWPAGAFTTSFAGDFSFWNFLYLIPISCSSLLIYLNLKYFEYKKPQLKLFTKSILILPPLALFLFNVEYYLRLFF